jgi:hypothetical protein
VRPPYTPVGTPILRVPCRSTSTGASGVTSSRSCSG